MIRVCTSESVAERLADDMCFALHNSSVTFFSPPVKKQLAGCIVDA
ncbi:hypothetical protein X011_16795 [Mycobacterium tuberculosis variant microti OV254]|nr:hypothetical protein X011_16795 [Mycobacterium tuberculosis variant microti OV254]